MKTRQLLRAEFLQGRSTFDWLFLCFGISLQIIVFAIQPDQPIAIVSGIAGIISVILCSQGKISTFLFGFVQISTYIYLCLASRLYAEVAINIFYLLSQFYGIYVWARHYHLTATNSAELHSRTLSIKMLFIISILSILISALIGYLLSIFTNDSQPYIDAFTTVPAIAAQIFLMLAYREQWYFWLFVDLLSVVMWVRAGNYCMVAQYAFWCINCIYGLHRWKQLKQ